MIEATALAFADGFKVITDSSVNPTSINTFLSKTHAEEKRSAINLKK